MNVTEGSYLNFQINKIPKSMQYQFFLRYQPKVKPRAQTRVSNRLENGLKDPKCRNGGLKQDY